nr:hypothetical protein [Tanacetum cinerariifolium]
ARMREIIRDQFATYMNEFMANMNSRAGGPRGAVAPEEQVDLVEMLMELVSEAPDRLYLN